MIWSRSGDFLFSVFSARHLLFPAVAHSSTTSMNWFIFLRSHNIDPCLQDGLPKKKKKKVKILLETVKSQLHRYYRDDRIELWLGTEHLSLEFPDHFWLTVTDLEVQTASVTLWRSWVAKEYSSGLSSNYQVAAKKIFKNHFCAHGWPVEQMVQGEQTDEEEWRSDPSGNSNISQGSSALQSVLFSGSKCFRTC